MAGKVISELIERVMSKGASRNEAVEAVAKTMGRNADEIDEVLKYSDDIPSSPMGQGKNLGALQEAKVGAPDIGEANVVKPDAPSYPSNITQDELATRSPFKLEGEPVTKDFTMPDPDAGLPVVRGNTLPEVVDMPKLPEYQTSIPSRPKFDAQDYKAPTGPDLTPPRKAQVNTVESLDTKTRDQIALNTPFRPDEKGMSVKNILTGTAVGLGGLYGANELFGDSPQQQIPLASKPNKEITPPVTENKPEDATAPKKPVDSKKGKQNVQGEVTPPVEPPKTEEKTEPKSKEEDVLDKYMKMMDEAEQKRQDGEFINAMYRAGIMAGSAIAGVKPDYALVDALDKLVDSDVKRVKNMMGTQSDVNKLKQARKLELLEEKANDPNNALAVKATLMMKSRIPNFPEGHSVAEIEKLTGLKVSTILGYEENEKSAEKAFDRQKMLKQLELESAQREKENRLDERQRKYVSELRKETRSGELGKKYREFTKLNIIGKSLDEFAKNPTGYSDYATLMSGLKGLQGDESVVREAEIRLGMEAGSFKDQMMNRIDRLRTGKSLQPGQREAISNSIKILSTLNRQSYLDSIQPILTNAEQEGISKDLIIPPDVIEALGTEYNKDKKTQPSQTKTKKYSTGQQVRIRGKVYKVVNDNGDLEEVK
jgi:uncharacterized protein YoaH (UPF0181 family)